MNISNICSGEWVLQGSEHRSAGVTGVGNQVMANIYDTTIHLIC